MSLTNAFGNSMRGLSLALRSERAVRQEAVVLAVAVPAAALLADTLWVAVALIGVVLLVLCVELLNTAIESAVDRFGPEWHALSKRAKDLGSAAVMVSLLLCGGTWGLALLARFGG